MSESIAVEQSSLFKRVLRVHAIRTQWLTICICVAICGVDFSLRLNGPIDEVPLEALALAMPENFQTLGLSQKRFSYYIDKLSDQSGKTEKLEVLIEDNDDARTSELDSQGWQTNEHSYRLLGIFGRPERFAVLRRVHLETAKSELLELRVGDSVNGFSIDNLSETALSASHPDMEAIELVLFQPREKAVLD